MNILVDARSLGKRPSGVGMYLYSFLNGLVSYPDVQLGLLTDVSESIEMKSLEKQGASVYKYGKVISKSVGVYAYFHFVQKMVHEVKPDIFWEGNNLIPIKLKNSYGKVVTTVHDVFPITMPEAYGKIYPHYFRIYLRKTLKNVDAVIYNSVETRKETERVLPVAKQTESFLSYIVVDVTPNSDIFDEGYFLYIGNLEKRKGTDILLKAYERYRRQGGKRELVLAGKIREKEIDELLEQVSTETEGVNYAGYVDENKKDELFAKCGCFIFPSRAEGFGIPVIEAMTYGKPVIGSNLSIFKEITDGQIQTFELDEALDKSVINLTEAMFTIKQADVQHVKEIVTRYRGAVLTQSLKKYFDKIVG